MCLDVCGLAANLYRRNTPVIKVLEINPALSRPDWESSAQPLANFNNSGNAVA